MFYGGKRYFFVPLIIVGLVLFSLLTMVLWNSLATSILNLPVINFWQSAGLLILTRLLFGSFKRYGSCGGWHGHYRWHGFREKIAKMSPEERKEYFNRMCGGKYYGQEEDGKYYGQEEKV